MIEFVIIALLVSWSAVVVFKKVFPKTAYSVFLNLSQSCERQGWDSLATWLKPAVPAGCGGSCGCSTTDETVKKDSEIHPVKWR